jgi:hypothetical protein
VILCNPATLRHNEAIFAHFLPVPGNCRIANGYSLERIIVQDTPTFARSAVDDATVASISFIIVHPKMIIMTMGYKN